MNGAAFTRQVAMRSATRVSLTYEQAAALLDLICEREAERLAGTVAWHGVSPLARQALELLRAAKEALR